MRYMQSIADARQAHTAHAMSIMMVGRRLWLGGLRFTEWYVNDHEELKELKGRATELIALH
jgi:hypothetical protein